MKTATTFYAVQMCDGEIYLSQKQGNLPHPSAGSATIRMVAASICGADLRIAKGDKDRSSSSRGAVTMGHEGCGIIELLGEQAPPTLVPGQFVVVLPHIHVAEHCAATTATLTVDCTSRHHTSHAGWDFPGVFSEWGRFPYANLVPVPPEQLLRAEQATDLGRLLFTITEPFLCCLSSYDLLDRQLRALRERPLTPGRALVVGCGPIGIMHGIILADRGHEVSFYDTIPQRARLAQYCLGGGHVLTDRSQVREEGYDLVMVTANVLDAVRLGEAAVRDDGIVYLFAGMNAADREAMHPDHLFSYEKVHRLAQGVYTLTGSKRIFYLGHSGYTAQLAPAAIALVSANAGRLERLVTGVIDGFASPTIQSRLPGVNDWCSPDTTPALVAALRGKAGLQYHGKIVIKA